MKLIVRSALPLLAISLFSCQPTETAVTGTAHTVGNAAKGVGRTAKIAGTGAVNTVGNTVATAGSGIAERDYEKATVGTVKAAGKGTANTAVGAGKSHLNTSRGAVKDTVKTVDDTVEASR